MPLPDWTPENILNSVDDMIEHVDMNQMMRQHNLQPFIAALGLIMQDVESSACQCEPCVRLRQVLSNISVS